MSLRNMDTKTRDENGFAQNHDLYRAPHIQRLCKAEEQNSGYWGLMQLVIS